jgi:hypothetical protein
MKVHYDEDEIDDEHIKEEFTNNFKEFFKIFI